MAESIQYIREYFDNWDYSGNEEGEGYKHCQECGEAIEDGDYVLIELYQYKDNIFHDLWHPNCALKAEERMKEFTSGK